MRIFYLFLFIVLANNARPQQRAMFGGNAQHLYHFSTGKQELFDTRGWTFDARSPIRSTPLVFNGKIYFGTTAGVFFSVEEKTGELNWKHDVGSAINSSAAFAHGKIFFADNEQKLFALDQSNGHIAWSFAFGAKLSYPWRFDYYYSSPTPYKDWILIGGDDGWLYALHQSDGKLIWKYNVHAVIRATPAVNNDMVLFGDMDGRFHCLDLNTGKERWLYKTDADTMNNEDWGFDRKAILSSAVVANDKIFFGSRAGFLYCLNADGSLQWKMDHKISWVISTPAIKDSVLVTGTSDGRFVQAININSGKQIWRYRTAAVVWSSPIIINDVVHAADFDGIVYCIDLRTGKRVSQFVAGDRIMSSFAYGDGKLFFGSDDGFLYALTARPIKLPADELKRYVFYHFASKNYFQNGADLRIKDYLAMNGYKTIGVDSLESILRTPGKKVVAFASNYFPDDIIRGNDKSALRKFLDAGGRIVILGTNPLAYRLDDASKQPVGFNVPHADSVLGIRYGANDTRAFGGMFTCFPTEQGKNIGLPPFWASMLFCDSTQVDIILGKNENGLVSAFAKKYQNGGVFVQLFLSQRSPQNLDAIIKASDYDF
jgi:outer membrane protein assembly factor BamB